MRAHTQAHPCAKEDKTPVRCIAGPVSPFFGRHIDPFVFRNPRGVDERMHIQPALRQHLQRQRKAHTCLSVISYSHTCPSSKCIRDNHPCAPPLRASPAHLSAPQRTPEGLSSALMACCLQRQLPREPRDHDQAHARAHAHARFQTHLGWDTTTTGTTYAPGAWFSTKHWPTTKGY